VDREFHARGKLLLTGEYVVMQGARALACPTRRGQSMYTRSASPGRIHWKAYTPRGEVWLQAEWEIQDGLEGISETKSAEPSSINNITLKCVGLGKSEMAKGVARLQEWLQHAMRMSKATNPEHFREEIRRIRSEGIAVETILEFEREWGLGSSSSLISLLARWWGCPAMQLHAATQGGSGYDQACATAGGPIFYRINGESGAPDIRPAPFYPPFHEQLLFVYTGTKQSTDQSVRDYWLRQPATDSDLQQWSECATQMASATDLMQFMEIMHRHEQLMSEVLHRPPVQQSRFTGFPGQTKSLGAWGGDFVMAAAPEPERAHRYLGQNGYPIRFSFHELLLCPAPAAVGAKQPV